MSQDMISFWLIKPAWHLAMNKDTYGELLYTVFIICWNPNTVQSMIFNYKKTTNANMNTK